MKKNKILINNKTYEYKDGITLLEISNDFKEDFKFDIIISKVNNEMKYLNEIIYNDCKIVFYDLLHYQGNKSYERALSYIFIYCMENLFDSKVTIKHSIDKGICYELEKDLVISDLVIIRKKMKELVEKAIPFEKKLVDRLEAVEYFKERNMIDKVEILKQDTRDVIILHKFLNLYDYFYGCLPIDSSYIKHYDFELLDKNTIIVLFPNIFTDGTIEKYEHPVKIFNAFDYNYRFGKKHNINNIGDLNRVIKSGKLPEIIKVNEEDQNNRIKNIAETIKDNEKIRLILIGGPTSSGKTTLADKLSVCLKECGLVPKSISIDDYFVEREDTPKDENGNYDFESIKAIDIQLFNRHLTELLNGEEILKPTFNFITGKKEYKDTFILKTNEILILEGLHALNDELTYLIKRENKFKIYISPFISLNIDDHNRIPTTDLRLIRRIIRDHRTRGYDVSRTLELWKNVRKGEEKYVFPFKEENDIVFDSAFLYEVSILKKYICPLLKDVKENDSNYNEVMKLKEMLFNIIEEDSKHVPSNSLLREFIGIEKEE